MATPEERGFFGSLNTIVNLVESTCDQKWQLLVDTALPAAGAALYLLIVPDPDEILENYLQPRPRRNTPKRAKQGHGRRQGTRFGGRRWWQKIGFPDVDAIIAERLPGRDIFRGRNAGKPERWIWRGIDILDRGLWYWMLLDLADNFVVEWASGIVESRFCTSPLDGLFLATCHFANAGLEGQPTWNPPAGAVEVNKGWAVGTTSTIVRTTPNETVSGPVVVTWSGDGAGSRPGREGTYRLQVNWTDKDGFEHAATGPAVTIGFESGAWSTEVTADVAFCRSLGVTVFRVSGDNLTAETQDYEISVLAEIDK